MKDMDEHAPVAAVSISTEGFCVVDMSNPKLFTKVRSGCS